MHKGVAICKQGISSAALFYFVVTAQVLTDYDSVLPPFTLCLFQTEITPAMLHPSLQFFFLPPHL